METSLILLIITAATVGFLHTVMGPDHYLPFVALAKSKKWSMKKLCAVTFTCGMGHVMGSVLLALAGVFLGVAFFDLESIESVRGEVAAWLLFIFGCTYLTWAFWDMFHSKKHLHAHVHKDGKVHEHEHDHKETHVHVHATQKKKIVPWVLFVIFIFGPCEALIPLVMYPASQGYVAGVLAIVTTFALSTLLTMLGIVLLLTYGASRIHIPYIGKYAHIVTGVVLLVCGAGILFLGL